MGGYTRTVPRRPKSAESERWVLKSPTCDYRRCTTGFKVQWHSRNENATAFQHWSLCTTTDFIGETIADISPEPTSHTSIKTGVTSTYIFLQALFMQFLSLSPDYWCRLCAMPSAYTKTTGTFCIGYCTARRSLDRLIAALKSG